MLDQLDQLLQQLSKLREEHGEETYNQARRQIALAVILRPQGAEFIKRTWPDLDLDALAKEAASKVKVKAEAVPPQPTKKPETGPHPAQQAGNVNAMMVEMLRQQVPSISTQAQFNSFMACFDALRLTLDASFRGDEKAATEARAALNEALDMAARLKAVAEQVAEIPQEERSRQAQALIDPPAQYQEGDTVQKLLAELPDIETLPALNDWYAQNKPAFDKVVSQDLRNAIYDAVRQRRNQLQAQA